MRHTISNHGSRTAIAGSELTVMYRRERRAVVSQCRRILGDAEEAKDVAQAAWARLLTLLRDGEQPSNLAAFVRTMATHLCLDLLRSRRVKASHDGLLDAGERSATPPDRIERDELLAAVLLSCPRKTSDIATRWLARGEKAEIAQSLRVSERTVERHLAAFIRHAERRIVLHAGSITGGPC